MKAGRIATQVDAKVLKELKAHAKQTGCSISAITSKAMEEYLAKSRVRPAFRSATNKIIDENFKLFKKLEK